MREDDDGTASAACAAGVGEEGGLLGVEVVERERSSACRPSAILRRTALCLLVGGAMVGPVIVLEVLE